MLQQEPKINEAQYNPWRSHLIFAVFVCFSDVKTAAIISTHRFCDGFTWLSFHSSSRCLITGRWFIIFIFSVVVEALSLGSAWKFSSHARGGETFLSAVIALSLPELWWRWREAVEVSDHWHSWHCESSLSLLALFARLKRLNQIAFCSAYGRYRLNLRNACKLLLAYSHFSFLPSETSCPLGALRPGLTKRRHYLGVSTCPHFASHSFHS